MSTQRWAETERPPQPHREYGVDDPPCARCGGPLDSSASLPDLQRTFAALLCDACQREEARAAKGP